MPDGSIPHPDADAKKSPTIQQQRAWECVQVLLSDHAERLRADDLAALMDMAWIEPDEFTGQDIDDAILAYETYVENRA